MHPEIQINHRGENDWTVAEIHGEVDVYTAPKIREHVINLVEEGRHRIILDLLGVSFMDSSGLGMLVAILKRIRSREGELSLVITDPRIYKIFSITNLRSVFPIYESVAEATR